MIWAQSHGGLIGTDGALPWYLPEDLRMFRDLTCGATVVMGRATWESLPAESRPLPGRRNIVLTQQAGWSARGADPFPSVEAVLDQVADFWVVGGGAVYAAFEPHADQVIRTHVDLHLPGDVYAPPLGPTWEQVHRTPDEGWSLSRTGLRYAVTEHRRTRPA